MSLSFIMQLMLSHIIFEKRFRSLINSLSDYTRIINFVDAWVIQIIHAFWRILKGVELVILGVLWSNSHLGKGWVDLKISGVILDDVVEGLVILLSTI